MKMILKTPIYIVLIFCLFSCKQNNVNVDEQPEDTVTTVDPDLERKLQYESEKKYSIGVIDSTISNTYLLQIIAYQHELAFLLKDADSVKANGLYEDFSKKMISSLTDYNFSNSEILDNYVNYESADVPKEWQEKIEKLKKYDIELIYEGEGFHSFQYRHDYFYKTFKGKVTKDLEAFLYNYSEDDKNVFQMDAGIVVPWKDVRARVLRWEKYIKKYPESRYNVTAKEVFAYYLQSYLLGMDNTGTYELSTKEIYPEIQQEFLIFIKENPNTFSTEVVKDFLDFFEYAKKQYDHEAFSNQLNTHVNGILQESLNQH